MVLDFLLLVGLLQRLVGHFHLRRRLLRILLQHLDHRVPLLLQLQLLLCVGIADHVLDGSRGPI